MQEIVVRCVTDMEILELVGEAHRHRLSSVFPTPRIEVSVLKDVVAHPS